MIDVIVTQHVKPGMEAQAEALMRRMEAETLANHKGCLRFEWYRSDIPGTYVLCERWADREAARAHLNAPPVTALLAALEPYAGERFKIWARLDRLE